MSTEYINEYLDLLLFQYQQKPRATAEIELLAGKGEEVFSLLSELRQAYDVDSAVGTQLDVLGRIVGLSRLIPYAVSKIRFGFQENDNARGFDDKFSNDRQSAPFLNRFEPINTDYELDDESYRIFLRMKIAKNTGSAYIVTDDLISLQDATELAFGRGSHVEDKQDMTLNFWIPYRTGEQRAKIAVQERLFPVPQGVGLKFLFFGTSGETFGFKENPNALSFASKFDDTYDGGFFARKLI